MDYGPFSEDGYEDEHVHTGWFKFTDEGRVWKCSKTCRHPDHDAEGRDSQ